MAISNQDTTNWYRITDADGNVAYSEPAGMYLNEFAILEQPVDCAALIGDKASFSVTAYGDDLTYQWEASRDGVNWTASTAAGSQTDTISGITVTEDRIGRWYRCVITEPPKGSKDNATVITTNHVMIRSPFDTWEYTYNADGLRVGKTNTETTYQYYYNGDKLSRMNVDYADPDVEDQELHFGYDASGVPQYVIYGGHRYFYLTNLQGDVTGIVSMDGEIVVAYSYDAWGKPMPATGEMAATLGKDNPLRYRGYVYDEETKLYYLQSRYYDPAICRFINADVYVSTGQGLLSNNMFNYCLNNPNIHADHTGTDAVVLYDKDTFGHIGIMVQDEEYNWWHYYWGTKGGIKGIPNRIRCFFSASIEPYSWCSSFSGNASSLSEINAAGQYSGDYEVMHYFKGNFSGAVESMKSYSQKYNLYSNNCAQVSLRLLASANTTYSPLFNEASQCVLPYNANKFLTHNKNNYSQIDMRYYAAEIQKYAILW